MTYDWKETEPKMLIFLEKLYFIVMNVEQKNNALN